MDASLTSSTSADQGTRNFFDAFGFVVLRQVYEPDELRKEVVAALIDALGRTFAERPMGGGIEGHYLPIDPETLPRAHALTVGPETLGFVESLLGRRVAAQQQEVALFFGDTGWHSDDGIGGVPSVAMLGYLTPVSVSTGALRVMPRSHAGFPSDLVKWLNQAGERAIGGQVAPYWSLEMRPGDLVCFDERLVHGSFGGVDRLIWSCRYRAQPRTRRERGSFERKSADAAGRLEAIRLSLRESGRE